MKPLLCSGSWRFAMSIALISCCALSALAQIQFTGPAPGDVYREYSRIMRPTDGEQWRVTDPNINLTLYPQAAPYLPNPTLNLTVDDLAGATKAEAVITMWGGHIATYGRKVRFNGNDWINIPDLDTSNGTSPSQQGINYIHQVMVTVPVPLAHLVQGSNSFQGTNAGQLGPYGFQWGQHGWYALMVRVYYDAGKTHTTGQISSPGAGGTFNDNPTVSVSLDGSADRVDYLAYYDGYDTDGDGEFQEYHHDYHITLSDVEMAIRNHVGTATSSPYSVVWNTSWVPDQPAGSIKLLARIRGTNGVWYVTPEVTALSLARSGKSVRLYKPLDTPIRAWARGDIDVVRVNVNIPTGTVLSDASSAVYYHRSWNGLDNVREPGETHYRRFNSWEDGEYGGNHFFSYDVRTLPTTELQVGNNQFSFYSQTVAHHGMEILWPGPALSVTYTGSYASPTPATASLASPVHNATGQLVTLTLRWHPAAAASSYDLQVSTDSTFGSTVVNLTGLTDTSSQVGPLSNLTRYFWRVRGRNAAGAGEYTSYWAFNTFLASPTLASPANNATNQATTIPLMWRVAAGATQYRLQLSLNAGFTAGNVVKDTTLADTSLTLSGLQHNTPYYWRVAAQSGGSWGDYSSAWMFTTAVAPPAVPAQVFPANESIDQLVNITMRWQSVSGAAQYHVQMGTDSTFGAGLLVNDSTLTDTTRAVSGLAFNQRYHWRVRAKNAGGTSVYSSVWHFRTHMSVPNGPVLLTPALGAVEQPTVGLVFTWQPLTGATLYTFQLGTDSTFVTGLVKNDTTLTETTRTITGLAQGTRYFWRVAGRNAGGPGPFSSTWNFVTFVPVPNAVNLLSPGHMSVVGADSVRCLWNTASPAASRYWFEISVDPTFNSFSLVDSTVTDTAKVVKPLLNNATYYWRVRGGTATSWGAFSPVYSFAVQITSVEGTESVPEEFVLRQNYPNPFNPATEINFGLPKESRVRIEIYDLLGRQVALALDGVRSAGYHTIRFDAGKLTSGMYLYRLTSGEVSLFRKMLLLK